MAKSDISVTVGVEGESKFKTALKECQNTVKQLDSALKANAAEWDGNADATDENIERTELLNKAIAKQKEIVATMGEAIEWASEQYGEASKQTTDYIVAQNRAKEAVAKLEKELKDGDREMEELGRDSVRVGRQLEQGIGDGAEDAAKNLSDMAEEMQDALEDIGRSTGISATIDIAQNVMEGINGIIEETDDYRRTMSYLEQNAKDYGHSWEEVEAHAIHVASITGELDGAAEGISNLMAAGLNSAETADAVNLLLGAVIKFPDTYKFESLGEALRNTIEEGKAVGQFSELLLAMGVDLETFNKAMEKASDKETRQDIALSFGANRGLEQTAAEYMLANEEMLKANEAALTYKGTLAELAEALQPVSTAWTNLASAAVSTVTSILGDTQVDEWVTARLEEITEFVRKLGTPEGREEIVKEALGDNYGKTFTTEDANPEGQGTTDAEKEIDAIKKQIERQKQVIKELKFTGDAVQLMTAESLLKDLEAQLKEAEEVGKDTGTNVVDEITTAIEDGTPDLVDAAAALVDEVNAEFAGITVPDVAGTLENQAYRINQLPTTWYSGNTGAGRTPLENKTYQISMNVNGRNFANAIIDDLDIAQGRTVALG